MCGGAVLAAVCVVVVGCGGSTPSETPPASDLPTSEVSGQPSASDGQQPAPEVPDRPKENPDPPGVPGSPIDYDSTLLYAPEITPQGIKGSIEGELERSGCGANRCGVTVEIAGTGKCAVKIEPDPVYPGGTVTIVTGECTPDEEPPPPEDEIPPSEEDIPPSDG